MPKRGKKNAAETERENEKRLACATNQRGGERDQQLEHHGPNRCRGMWAAG